MTGAEASKRHINQREKIAEQAALLIALNAPPLPAPISAFLASGLTKRATPPIEAVVEEVKEGVKKENKVKEAERIEEAAKDPFLPLLLIAPAAL